MKRVRIGKITIEDRELDVVTNRGAGSPGFEFKGHALEGRGKQIIDGLKSEEKEGPVECEAENTREGLHLSDLGKLENFKSQESETAPIRYSFEGTVAFVKSG